MNIYPHFIRRHIEHRPNLLKILDNIGWLFFDKVLRMGVGIIIGVWIARYLGPKQFGQLNYATAFVSLFGAFATLGLNSIVVRDIVRDPDSTYNTLGAAFVMQLVGGLISFVLVVGIITWLHPEDELMKSMVAILGFSLIFKAIEVVKYWFESQIKSRYTVFVENSILLLIVVFKVSMLLGKAPLIAFVWVVLIEAILVAVGLFWVYHKLEGKLRNWTVRLDRVISLMKDSLPLILMSIVIVIYRKIDLLMVEYYLGWEATGLYAAATTIAESWFFIALILVKSLFPYLIRSEKYDEEEFRAKLTIFYSVMFWFSCVISFSLYMASSSIIVFLYGEDYIDAVPVFQLYIWSGIFVFVITSSSRWFLIKNRNVSLFWRALLGATMNVALNFWWIREYGLIGAALSTLVSYFTVAYVYDFFDKSVREQLRMKFDGIIFPARWLWARI